MKSVKFVLVLLLAFSSSLIAQNTGSISGVVTDPSGAVVDGASVTVTNVGTNSTRSVTSNSSGFYSVPNLVPGTYTVAVEKSGFRAVKFANTPLTVAQSLSLDAKLSVGAQEQSIEVNGQEVAPIETESNQLSTLVDSKTIVDLPLLTRNPYELVLLSPGAIQTNDASPAGGFSVNGSRDRNNNFLLDGVDNNDTGVPGTPSGIVSINPDSTQEFRVISNDFNAEYGRNTGAIVDIVTRSGTNQFHGDAYWFGRYNALGARNFFNRDPDPQDPYVRNQFGFSVGGPIIKDRTFFFINNEYQRYRTTLTVGSIVPTAAFDSGLFTTPDGQQVDLRTPTSPGNLTGLGLDPTIAKVLQLLPAPNAGDVIPGLTGTLNFPSPDSLNSYTWTAKIDHKISQKHQLALRYAYNHSVDSNPFHSETAPGLDAISSPAYTHGVFAGLTSTLKNTLVNDFKFGWNKLNSGFASNCGSFLDPITGKDSFGYGRDFGAPDAALGVGPLSVIGCNGLFDSAAQTGHRGTTSYADTVTWVRGNHTIKFGGDFRHVHSTGDNNFSSRDTLGFNRFALGGGPAVNLDVSQLDAGTFQTIQDLSWMLVGGTITQFQAQFFNKTGSRVATDDKTFIQHEYDGFIQDSWKVRSNFTLNVGLRYQFNGVPFEKDGNFSNLLTNANTAGPFDITVVGPGTGKQMYTDDYKDIEPRIGFAWDPFKDGNTSVRAGYGIFHDRIFDNLFGNARSNPPFQSSVSNLFNDPTTPGSIPFAVSAPPGTHFVNGDFATLTLLDPNIRMPASQNWNFGLQRKLPRDLVFEANYVGSHGTHVIRSLDAVPPDPALVQAAIAACVTNGGCAPGDPEGVISNGTLYTGIPGIAPPAIRNTAIQSQGTFPPTNITRTNADSNYQALQVKVNKQFTHGLLLGGAYTWSHAIDDSNDPLTPEAGTGSFPVDSLNPNVTSRGNSDNDIRHRGVIDFSYELPFGKGKSYLAGGIVGRVLEGIQISGIVSAQTGHPYSIYTPLDNGRNGVASFSYPDVIGNPFIGGQRINADGNVLTGASNNDAFSANFLGHIGDAGRNQFYGPHYTNADVSLMKNMTLTERFKIQLRSEFFNVLNHPEFAQPGHFAGTSTLGLSTATLIRSDGTTSARQIQLALKLFF
jgi:Carboxypeptidase regulatory-like domain/TonB-dependent Receptor Plug Domain